MMIMMVMVLGLAYKIEKSQRERESWLMSLVENGLERDMRD